MPGPRMRGVRSYYCPLHGLREWKPSAVKLYWLSRRRFCWSWSWFLCPRGRERKRESYSGFFFPFVSGWWWASTVLINSVPSRVVRNTPSYSVLSSSSSMSYRGGNYVSQIIIFSILSSIHSETAGIPCYVCIIASRETRVTLGIVFIVHRRERAKVYISSVALIVIWALLDDSKSNTLQRKFQYWKKGGLCVPPY